MRAVGCQTVGHLRGMVVCLRGTVVRLREAVGHLRGTVGCLRGAVGRLRESVGYQTVARLRESVGDWLPNQFC